MSLDRPHDGVRIIDLTRELPSHATWLFADFGAEITAVELPEERAERRHDPLPGGAGYGDAAFVFRNSGKMSVIADWRTAVGAAALARLVASAQVAVLDRHDARQPRRRSNRQPAAHLPRFLHRRCPSRARPPSALSRCAVSIIRTRLAHRSRRASPA